MTENQMEPDIVEGEVVEKESSQSATIGKLAGALATAQGEMAGAAQDKENPFFRSKYADLSSVWDACRKPLADNKLAVIQTMMPDGDGRVCVKTTLAHESGEFISGVLSVRPVRSVKDKKTGNTEIVTCDDPQAMGSAITYARRYSLAAMVGVAPEDDDGNAATQPGKRTQPPKEEKKQPPPAKQPPKPTPQQKADDQGSPIVQLWIKAEAANVPQEEWKLWCKEFAITKDRRTQGTKKLEQIEKKIKEWAANSRDEEERLFISEDELAWLKSTAKASQLDIQGEEGLLKFCQAAINNWEMKELKHLTKDEFDICMKELNERSAEGGGDA